MGLHEKLKPTLTPTFQLFRSTVRESLWIQRLVGVVKTLGRTSKEREEDHDENLLDSFCQ